MFIKRLLFVAAVLAVAACSSTLTDPSSTQLRPDSVRVQPK